MDTPTYYGNVSSQLKAFIDRTYSRLKSEYLSNLAPSRLAPNKQLVFIITQGHPDESYFAVVFPTYNNFFRWYGFQDGLLIRACGLSKPDDISGRRDVLEMAEETARKIMAGG